VEKNWQAPSKIERRHAEEVDVKHSITDHTLFKKKKKGRLISQGMAKGIWRMQRNRETMR